MGPNFFRLTLLDLFELLTAGACATYVCQYGGSYDGEYIWVLSAVSSAAVIIWLATRLGKAPPIPGLFIVAYIAALYGLSDLSPWMTVFGRLAVLETAQRLYPESMQAHGSQERFVTIAIVAALMTVPATLVGNTWAAIRNLVQLAQKKFEAPNTLFGRATIAARFTLALLLIAGLGYYSLRPQIRYVRTIRLPSSEQVGQWSKSSELVAMQPADFRAWTISSTGNQIVLLGSNRKLLEVGLNGVIQRATPIFCDLNRPRYLFQFEQTISSTIHPPSLKPRSPTDRFADIRIWRPGPDRLLIEFQSTYTTPEIELYDLSLGRLIDRPATPGVERVVAVSENGKYFAIEYSSRAGGAIDRVGAWNSTTKKMEHSQTWSNSSSAEFIEDCIIAVTNTGKIVKVSPPEKAQAEDRPSPSRFQSLKSSATEAQHSADVTDNGAWSLLGKCLTSSATSGNLLSDWRDYCVCPKLECSTGRVVLFGQRATSSDGFFFDETIETPILESLLVRAHRSQLTLFDPTTKAASTSWLKQGIFRRPKFDAAKFTPDGKYLVVQTKTPPPTSFIFFQCLNPDKIRSQVSWRTQGSHPCSKTSSACES